MRVGLVACGLRKLGHPAPARELYTGHLFRQCVGWAILSALHGLVLPDQVIAPYNLKLDTVTGTDRHRWVARTRDQIAARWDPVTTTFVTTAGSAYRAALAEFPHVECPWDDLTDSRMGFQQRWLRDNTPEVTR